MYAQDYSSKAVETGTARLKLIGGDPRAAAPDKWGSRPYPMESGPHLLGGVFLSLLEYSGVDVRVFSVCKSDVWISFYYYFDNPMQKQIFTKTHGNF